LGEVEDVDAPVGPAPKPEPKLLRPLPPPAAAAAAVAPDGETEAQARELAAWGPKATAREPIEVPLVYPIQFGSSKIDRFVMQPATMRVLKHFTLRQGARTYEHYVDAIGLMANQPPEVVEALAPVDGDRLVAVVVLFWAASRRRRAPS
jgi:hypothetical protein